MKYNFDEVVDRRNFLSIKWNVKENDLPMWIADMDFKTAPCVIDAIKKDADHGIYGYTYIPDSWYDAIINWRKRRYNHIVTKDSLIFTTGVIAAISSIVRRVTHPNDNVVLLTPVYNTFYNSIINNGARPLESNLIYKDGKYEIDFNDLENKLANPLTTLMILCNPHNPTGNIWSRETLAKIGDLCLKYGAIVLSDEIHCDLLDPGYEFIPFASVNETCANNSITALAPSKSFNLAGLQGAAIIIKNKTLYNTINRGLNNDEVAEANAFVLDATIAAYNEGEEWLDELRQYIYENKQISYKFIDENIPDIKAVKSHATYLLWIDISKICNDSNDFTAFLKENVGLYLSSGAAYHGNGFMRMNIACPKSILLDGLNRLKKGVELYKNKKNCM